MGSGFGRCTTLNPPPSATRTSWISSNPSSNDGGCSLFAVVKDRHLRDLGLARGVAADGILDPRLEEVADHVRLEAAGEHDQRRTVGGARIGVVDHHRVADEQRLLDLRELPRILVAGSPGHQILAHLRVRGAESLAKEAALARRLEPDEDDQLRRHRAQRLMARIPAAW